MQIREFLLEFTFSIEQASHCYNFNFKGIKDLLS